MTPKTDLSYKMFPYDLHLSIVNHLSLQDAKNYGIFLEKEKEIQEHMLTKEYLFSLFRKKDLVMMRALLIQSTTTFYENLLSAFKNVDLKPVRVNTGNGVFYTLYPFDLTKSIMITNIKIPQFPDKEISFTFQTVLKNEYHIYLGGLDIFLVIKDDAARKRRTVFIRIPYDCDEYIYGFAGNMTLMVAKRVANISLEKDWDLHCEYMMCQDKHKDTMYVQAIMPKYKTRNVDIFKHRMIETTLNLALDGNIERYNVQPWNAKGSQIQTNFALMKYTGHIKNYMETTLQGLGFTNNSEKITDVFKNIQTQQFYVMDYVVVSEGTYEKEDTDMKEEDSEQIDKEEPEESIGEN